MVKSVQKFKMGIFVANFTHNEIYQIWVAPRKLQQVMLTTLFEVSIWKY